MREPCPLNPQYGYLWWLNTGRGQFPSASAGSMYIAPGAAFRPTTSVLMMQGPHQRAGGFVDVSVHMVLQSARRLEARRAETRRTLGGSGEGLKRSKARGAASLPAPLQGQPATGKPWPNVPMIEAAGGQIAAAGSRRRVTSFLIE